MSNVKNVKNKGIVYVVLNTIGTGYCIVMFGLYPSLFQWCMAMFCIIMMFLLLKVVLKEEIEEDEFDQLYIKVAESFK